LTFKELHGLISHQQEPQILHILRKVHKITNVINKKCYSCRQLKGKYMHLLVLTQKSQHSWKITLKLVSREVRSRDSVVGIVTGRPRGRSSSPGRVKNFLFSTSSRQALGSTQPPIQRVPGALSPKVKRLGSEADHSSPTSAEAKKMWIYTHSPIRLQGIVLN
jgi:hypothetical protein